MTTINITGDTPTTINVTGGEEVTINVNPAAAPATLPELTGLSELAAYTGSSPLVVLNIPQRALMVPLPTENETPADTFVKYARHRFVLTKGDALKTVQHIQNMGATQPLKYGALLLTNPGDNQDEANKGWTVPAATVASIEPLPDGWSPVDP